MSTINEVQQNVPSDSEMSYLGQDDNDIIEDVDMVTDESSEGEKSMHEEENNVFNCTAINKINDLLLFIDESPLKLRENTRTKSQKMSSLNRIFNSIATKVFGLNLNDLHPLTSCPVAKNIKNAMDSTVFNEKVRLLTLFGENYSNAEIESFCEVGRKAVEKSKGLLLNKGVYGELDEMYGVNKLSQSTVDSVKSFYLSDKASRMMPGKGDYKVVKVKGVKEKRQKKLLMGTVSELFELFRSDFPDVKIGLTKFSMLRPIECISVNNKGVHNVCVCTYHQNPKLMSKSISWKNNMTWKHHFSFTMCNPPSLNCFSSTNECNECPQYDDVIENLVNCVEKMEETVTYKSWTSVDRSSLSTITEDFDCFLQIYANQLTSLKSHDLIARMQPEYFDHSKRTQTENEAIVLLDFSENLSIEIQDAAQSYYYAKRQVTVHPVIVYVQNNGKCECFSFSYMSDDLKHDKDFVYCLQKDLIPKILSIQPKISKIMYFSDGCKAQYKSKYSFANIYYHCQDFNVKCEWNFWPTSHGKNAIDGIGGTVKRVAHSQMMKGKLFTNALSLVDNLNSLDIKTSILLLDQKDIDKTRRHLKRRYGNSLSIEGTMHFHQVCESEEENHLCFKKFSSSNEIKCMKVIK